MDTFEIPQEILDHIIDYFHKDRQTLVIIALVARAWLPAARTHLFYRISLEPPKSSSNSSFLFKKLRSSQRLHYIISQQSLSLPSNSSPGGSNLGGVGVKTRVAPYVRELSICEGMFRQEWLAQERSLPLLLQSLCNVRRFEFSRSASMRISWRLLPKELQLGIRDHILSLRSLTELKLHGLMLSDVGQLQRMLGSCRSLRVLEVGHMGFENTKAITSEIEVEVSRRNGHSNRKSISLDSLIIGPRTSPDVLSCFLEDDSPLEVNTVRRLSLSMSGDFAYYSRLLRNCASVEYLELNLMNDVDLQAYHVLSSSDQLNLSDKPYLTKLKIVIDTIQKQDDPLPWIKDLLSTANTASLFSNSITDIWIVYALYLPAPYMDRSVNTTIFEGWRDVDLILGGYSGNSREHSSAEEMHPSPYSNLKSVRLHFMLENPIGFGVAPRFLKEVVLPSPKLQERGIFSVDAFDTSV